MKKTAAFLTLAIAIAFSIPAAATVRQPKQQHNKYQGLTKADRKAQNKEEKQMAKYARKQQKTQRKMSKAVNKAGKNKHNLYKPKHS